MMQQRDTTYDIMKGFGIIMVLIGHIWQLNGTILSSFICSCHMPLFFIVAGCFSKSYDDISGDLKNTAARYIRRLYVPFLVSTMLIVLWFVLKTIYKTKYLNDAITTFLSAIWGSVIVLHTPYGVVGVGALWFLMALLSAKIFFLFVSRWGKWTGVVCFVLSPLAVYLYSFNLSIPWCLLHGVAALPFIYIGYWWRRHHEEIPLWMGLLLIACWSLAIVFSKLEMVYLAFGCYPLDMLGAVGGTWAFFHVSRWISIHLTSIARTLAVLGLYSLAIYCWHSIDITASIFRQLLRLAGLPDTFVVIEYCLRYAATLMVAFVSIRLPFFKKVFA